MKLTLTCAALLLPLLALAPNAAAQTCSCTASDRTCNVEVKCSRGCGAICATRNACYAACGNFESDLLDVRITLSVNGVDGRQVADRLTSQVGKEVEFSPRKANDLFTLELKDSPLFYVLDTLSKRGRIKVGGTDFRKFQRIRALMLRDGRVSIKLNNLTVEEALDKLTFLSGRHFRVASGNAAAPVNISIRAATLRQIVSRISRQTGVKISQTRNQIVSRVSRQAGVKISQTRNMPLP